MFSSNKLGLHCEQQCWVLLLLPQTSSGTSRMCWKMSIDLSRPLVSSMGNLDPYDGLVTCTLLQQAADTTLTGTDSQGSDVVGLDQGLGGKVLQAEIAELQSMVDARYQR